MQNAKRGRKKPASGIKPEPLRRAAGGIKDAAREVRAEIPPEPYKGISKKEWFALAPVLAVAAVFLFLNLGTKYLWQDEAFTAVLGARMMKYGKPLAYDGVNLLTGDMFFLENAKNLDSRTESPQAAIRYYVGRHDFKADTTWTLNPWAIFCLAGASISLFGRDTVAARLPFAIAALLTVFFVYLLVRRYFNDALIAWLAAAMLVANVFWIIHSRQCRYYSLSCLFLMLTLITFMQWQAGRRFGGVLFVLSAWCWFQMDYGSFWPMIGILLAAAAIACWPRISSVAAVGAAIGISVAPWVWYYELADRLRPGPVPSWTYKFLLNLFHMNQFLLPGLVLAAALMVLWFRWSKTIASARMVLTVSIAMLLAALIWVPTVTQYAFLRYIVHLSPLAAIVTAWVLCEGARRLFVRTTGREVMCSVTAVSAAVFLAVCPLLSNVLAYPIQSYFNRPVVNDFVRSDWTAFAEEVLDPQPDPNRETIETLDA